MKSKFSFASYFPILVASLLIIGMILYLILLLKEVVPTPPLKSLPLLILLTFTLVWLFWGEFRTKMIKVSIEGDSISVKRFGGIWKREDFSFTNFDGYVTSRQSYGARGVLEYLYLMKGDRKVIRISEAYHENYADLKANIETKVKNLGYQNFNFIDELKEIFL